MSGARTVLVTPPNFDAEAIAFLESRGFRVAFTDKPEGAMSEAELVAALDGAGGWIIGPQANVTRSLISAAPSCRVFSRRGVGYERVDVAAARELGRVATIATGGNEDSVADEAIGLMLALGRRVRLSPSLCMNLQK